ncbi:MAG TPA: site-specific DNA-methyltransferase [Pyrinomonadaceae bacterium]|nr:site-specific DNA-methyltransferase [Pyrinomonadaceae bacterium]
MKQKAAETETVDKIEFEPIKGYPMLYWKGKRPFTSTQYYPAQLKETYGPEVNGWRNRIYWGDNLQVMSHLLKEFRGKIDLIYIDPPFDSKADYKKKIQLRGHFLRNDQNAFEEKQYTDIWTNDEYLQFMYERLVLLRELLSKEGSIYLHCDWHKHHYLRCLLDEIFGGNGFRNEVVWQKCNSKNYTQSNFSNIHDTILFYTKSEEYSFNEVFEELDPEYVRKAYRHTEPDGRKYRLLPLHAPGMRKGATGGLWRGKPPLPGNHWRFHPSTLDSMLDQGLIVDDENGNSSYKKYLESSNGIRTGTIWLDAKQLPASEDLEYPTQKPEVLLERIIEATSNPGDLVFDPFMGSGTTQAVAMELGRRFIGADINLGAIQITTKRLVSLQDQSQSEKLLKQDEDEFKTSGFEVYNVNHYDVFRNPIQAKDILIEALEVQPLPASVVYDGEKDGRLVKLMPVNRLATRADLNELIANFDYKTLEKKHNENPNKPVEKLLLVCMGHEPDLAAHLQKEMLPFKLDIEVVDILRDRSKLEFKRDSEAKISSTETELVIEKFYPMNLLQKLSLFKENVEDWRELVESVMIDFNYDGAIFQPTLLDIPEKNELVTGKYEIPADAGIIRVKITDLLSESLEVDA